MVKSEVAEKKGSELAVIDFSEEAGAGFENTTMEDYARSFLGILEKLSPILNKDSLKFIDGANPGDIYNNVTNEIWKGSEGIRVLPLHYEKKDVEWGANRSGFVAEYDPSENMMAKTRKGDDGRKNILPNGNELNPTAKFFVLYEKAPDQWDVGILAMTSTRLKSSREWLTKMQGIKLENPAIGEKYTPPMFSHIYRLTSKKVQKDDLVWYIWDTAIDSVVQDTGVFNQAKELHVLIRQGELKAKMEDSKGAEAEKEDEKAPF